MSKGRSKMGTKKNQRKKYSEEFKKDAVNLLISSDQSARQVGKNLGINGDLLSKWKKDYYNENTNKVEKKIDPKDEVIKKLEKENASLRMERDILKKSIAIFSRT